MDEMNDYTYDTDDTNNSKLLFSKIIYAVLIILFLWSMLSSLFSYFDSKAILKDNCTVTATVTEATSKGRGAVRNPTIYVDYEVDGKKYRHIRLGQLGYRMSNGDTITVCYNRKNPSKIATSSSAEKNLSTAGSYFFISFIVGIAMICLNKNILKKLVLKQ